jgi:hypothetical protein
MKDASEKTGYICHYEDLNKTLPDALKTAFQALFAVSDEDNTAWRMHYA